MNREILFNKLDHAGIGGPLWTLLRNMYQGSKIKVKWQNKLSDSIQLMQGTKQGAKLSTTLYKVYNNSILDSINNTHMGCHIGNINISCPTCADDIALLANNHHEIQALLDIVHHHTELDQITINASKSELVVYGGKSKDELYVTIGSSTIVPTEETKHLGITRSKNNRTIINERIKAARNTIYALL